MENVKDFIFSNRKNYKDYLYSAISLFSGAGLSDLGYEAAGFEFFVHSEKDFNRAKLLESNFGEERCIVGDIESNWKDIVDQYINQTTKRLDLLSVTPPCQGMSSSNPGRGKISIGKTSDKRNLLLLNALPIIKELDPKIIVIENVPQVLNRVVCFEGRELKVIDIFKDKIKDNYELFSKVIQMADYGVPQLRRRAVLVALNVRDFNCEEISKRNIVPIPRSTHSCDSLRKENQWITFQKWIDEVDYPKLDAVSFNEAHSEDDLLHFVPNYEGHRYLLVSDIPSGSGKSAYQNSICHFCGKNNVPEKVAYCPKCNNPMINRPYVIEKDGSYRLIRGFKSSYRRMYPDKPAATITTANGHIGSDNKIHPFENRLLSIRECADLQTIPRSYNWDWALDNRHINVIREVIGEALPPWFTYQHGLFLRNLLKNEINYESFCEK